MSYADTIARLMKSENHCNSKMVWAALLVAVATCIHSAAASANSAVRTGSPPLAAAAAATALLSPSYIDEGIPGVKGSASTHADLLAVLALTGLANRAAPTLWLNSTSKGWVNGVPVMWSYPQADSTWLAYLEKEKNISFERAKDAKLCTLLSNTAVAAAVKGLVMYEDVAVSTAPPGAATAPLAPAPIDALK